MLPYPSLFFALHFSSIFVVVVWDERVERERNQILNRLMGGNQFICLLFSLSLLFYCNSAWKLKFRNFGYYPIFQIKITFLLGFSQILHELVNFSLDKYGLRKEQKWKRSCYLWQKLTPLFPCLKNRKCLYDCSVIFIYVHSILASCIWGFQMSWGGRGWGACSVGLYFCREINLPIFSLIVLQQQ